MTATPRHQRPTLRLAVALVSVAVMVLQLWVSGYFATAVVSGIEICSSSGPRYVDGNGLLLPDHTAHDCCCTAALGLFPAQAGLAMEDWAQTSPASRPAARKFGAEWLGSLSRGPPSLS